MAIWDLSMATQRGQMPGVPKIPGISPVFTSPRAKCIFGQQGQEGTLLQLLLLGRHRVRTRDWYWS